MWPLARRPTKRAILVLGAPRSGTSVVAHAISEMGVDFGNPSHFVDPSVHTHNPIFFELQRLNALNDAIFERFGTSFGAFDWMPNVADLSRVREFDKPIARLMAEEFGGAPLVGLKDPRFCFTLPVWRRALGRLGYATLFVVTHRSPHAVLSSNQKINGLPTETNFRLVALSDLLPRTLLKDVPDDVVNVSYEALVESSDKACLALAAALHLNVSASSAASSVVDRSLVHHGNVRQPPPKCHSP